MSVNVEVGKKIAVSLLVFTEYFSSWESRAALWESCFVVTGFTRGSFTADTPLAHRAKQHTSCQTLLTRYGRDARQGLVGSRVKIFFCYARCLSKLREEVHCGQGGVSSSLCDTQLTPQQHAGVRTWKSGKRDYGKRNKSRGPEVISDQRLAYAGSSRNGSGIYSTSPESFTFSYSLGLHETTPPVNVVRKLCLGIFLWSINSK